MARFTQKNIEQFEQSSGSNTARKTGYFSLKKDKETARVRFLYEDIDDIVKSCFTVHKVKVGDRERYVNCLRETDDPIDACPFCQAGLDKMNKMFVPLYNEDTQQIQTWERGKKFYGRITGLCARYPNIVSRTFDIERNGAPGSTDTTYEIFPVDGPDETSVDDILADADMDELPDALGTIILNKTADEMDSYIENGDFPMSKEDAPVRRRATPAEDETPRRRSRGEARGRGDRF